MVEIGSFIHPQGRVKTQTLSGFCCRPEQTSERYPPECTTISAEIYFSITEAAMSMAM